MLLDILVSLFYGEYSSNNDESVYMLIATLCTGEWQSLNDYDGNKANIVPDRASKYWQAVRFVSPTRSSGNRTPPSNAASGEREERISEQIMLQNSSRDDLS
ncbi:hypothetical protein ANCCEY_01896 [Ancylostoma ceylanicum]|uniref:Uncharacterized protein n=1 Tax=Ancylostoma ceylanicum TaxID=53326 RepID=A0A0D6M4F9_9BILA|nr:hypothetical protein ANCCEY_01896 [Ancylostoma ceylanicum]